MRPTLLATFLAPLVVIALAPGSALADHDRHAHVDVHVDGDDGSRVSLSIDGGLLGEILADVATDVLDDLRVEAELDRDVEAMLRYLDREGDGARYTLRGDDGEVVRAHRHGSDLELDIRDADGDRSRVEIPWALAEILLGRPVSRADRDGALDIRVEDDDGSVRVHVH